MPLLVFGALDLGTARSTEPPVPPGPPVNGGPPPLTGAWQLGHPPGRRHFVELFHARPLPLECGSALGPVTVAYESWGTLSPARDNAVLVEHTLTGNSHAAGPADAGHLAAGWWDPLIGPGRAIDTDRWWVLCANTLGGCQGTTGPASCRPDGSRYGATFPVITTRDQYEVEVALADHLGVDRWAAVIGASMGGSRVLEWAVGTPDRVARAVVIGCGASATANQIALGAIQAEAIRLDPGWHGGDYYDLPTGEGPHRGLALARQIGQLSYRSEGDLATRFGRRAQTALDPLLGGVYQVVSYLDHQGAKLAARFDANSYLVLRRATDHYDIGRGRGGVRAALERVTARATVAGIDSDRVYPLRLQHELAEGLPGRPAVQVLHTPTGHDAVMVAFDQMGSLIRGALEQ